MNLLLLSMFFSTLFVNSSFAGDNNPDAQDIGGQKSRDQEVCVIGPNRHREGDPKKQKNVGIEEDRKSDGDRQEESDIASILNQLNTGLGWWG